MVGRTLLIALISCTALILHGLSFAAETEKEAKPETPPPNPIVLMKTSLGQIKI
jgi:hypothetical protein